mgnify:CR=1 FL=1
MSPTFIYIPKSGPQSGLQDFKINYLSVGAYSSIARDIWGDIYVWGLNNLGQLGDGSTSTRQTPTKNSTLSALSVDTIEMGNGHCLYTLTTDSLIYGFGLNSAGQLGFPSTTSQYLNPITVFSGGNIEAFGIGHGHSLISSAWAGGSNGLRLFTAGENNYSQLGRTGDDEAFEQITIPSEFDSMLGLTHKFSGGLDHSLIVFQTNIIYGVGRNNSGQLGLGHTTSPITTPTLIPNTATLFGFSNPKQIECSKDATYVLTDNGKVWVTGENSVGQLGLGDASDRSSFTQITTVNDGTSNQTIGIITKIGIGWDQIALLDSNGKIYLAGGGLTSTPTIDTYQVNNPSIVFSDVDCGNDFTIAKDNNNVAWARGVNASFQLGLGDTTPRTEFTKVQYTLP